MPDVVVIGAGISGLTCARRLQQLGFEPLVLESGDRIGGVIRSQRVQEHLIEWGPNSLLPTEHSFQILDELGLTAQLIQANPRAPRYIVVGGKLRKVPFGPLTVAGITRAMAEPFVRSKAAGDESIATFARRRFGLQVHDRLVAPAVSGIYAGDTEKLSIAACFPRISKLEREYGSVVLGMLRGRSGKTKKRRAVISSFPEGLETLTQRMAAGLTIQLKSCGIRIGQNLQAKATVLATPAYRSAEVVESSSPDLAEALRSIEYSPIVVAATSLGQDSLPSSLQGFGFLVPQTERLNILGTVFNSLLFPGRAPQGRLLLTSFLGGALRPEVFDWPEERVWDVVCKEVKHVLKSALQPRPLCLFRHRRAIPQYTIGHNRRVDAIGAELRKLPGLFITGNFLEGVSVPACMEHADRTAYAVADFLRSTV